MGDLVSVIVPIYNVEEYLRACVDSILLQSYRELEIILVDDGSLDGCGDICDAYQEQDCRVRVLHKKNGGLSDARNAGLQMAVGTWIIFVDGDDVLHPQLVEQLFKLVRDNEADISVCRLRKFTDTFIAKEQDMPIQVEDMSIQAKDMPAQMENKYLSMVLDMKTALSQLLYQTPPLETSAPGKLYKRSLFDGILFPVGLYYEDLATIYRIVMKSTRVVTVQNALYGYRMRQTSIMHENASSKMLSCIPVSRQLFEEVSKVYPDLTKAAASRAFSVNRSIYLHLSHSRKKERQAVWQEIKKYRGIVIRDGNARGRERLMALVSYLGPEVMHWFSGLYKKQQDKAQ